MGTARCDFCRISIVRWTWPLVDGVSFHTHWKSFAARDQQVWLWGEGLSDIWPANVFVPLHIVLWNRVTSLNLHMQYKQERTQNFFTTALTGLSILSNQWNLPSCFLWLEILYTSQNDNFARRVFHSKYIFELVTERYFYHDNHRN